MPDVLLIKSYLFDEDHNKISCGINFPQVHHLLIVVFVVIHHLINIILIATVW